MLSNSHDYQHLRILHEMQLVEGPVNMRNTRWHLEHDSTFEMPGGARSSSGSGSPAPTRSRCAAPSRASDGCSASTPPRCSPTAAAVLRGVGTSRPGPRRPGGRPGRGGAAGHDHRVLLRAHGGRRAAARTRPGSVPGSCSRPTGSSRSTSTTCRASRRLTRWRGTCDAGRRRRRRGPVHRLRAPRRHDRLPPAAVGGPGQPEQLRGEPHDRGGGLLHPPAPPHPSTRCGSPCAEVQLGGAAGPAGRPPALRPGGHLVRPAARVGHLAGVPAAVRRGRRGRFLSYDRLDAGHRSLAEPGRVRAWDLPPRRREQGRRRLRGDPPPRHRSGRRLPPGPLRPAGGDRSGGVRVGAHHRAGGGRPPSSVPSASAGTVSPSCGSRPAPCTTRRRRRRCACCSWSAARCGWATASTGSTPPFALDPGESAAVEAVDETELFATTLHRATP
jgi:hypothetical protein